MVERYGFSDYREIPTSQRSTEFIFSALGLSVDEIAGETVLDLGSGTRQQLAQDLEKVGATVVSLDPNLPHTDEYVVKCLLNDLGVTPDWNYDLASLSGVSDTESLGLFIEGILKSNPAATSIMASEWREMRGWPLHPYGKAVAGKGQALPFGDRKFNRIIATTSVPYGLMPEEIPIALAEANRVLVRGGKGHFWPVGVGGTEEYISLDEIRSLIQKARRESETPKEKEYLSGFSLEIYESPDPSWQIGMGAAGLILGNQPMRKKTLILTRKVP